MFALRTASGTWFAARRARKILGQALIALGAPLTLGALGALAVTAAALVVLVLRLVREEKALARTFPDYVHYAATTKRIVPFVC